MGTGWSWPEQDKSFGLATETASLFKAWHEANPDFVDTRFDFPIIGKFQPITLFFLSVAAVCFLITFIVWTLFGDVISENVNKHEPAPFMHGNSNFFYKKDYKKLFKTEGIAVKDGKKDR